MDLLQFTDERKQDLWACRGAPLTAASAAQLCLGLENAQHNVCAISCVLLCVQDISTVSVQHMRAPMQHPSAVYGHGKRWGLDFGCFMVLSHSPLAIYAGCATEAVHSLEECRSRRNISVFIGFPTPR